MPTGRPLQAILEAIQARRQAAGHETPLINRVLGAVAAPVQPQTPARAAQQPRPPLPVPAAPQGPARGYDPQVEALQERMAAQGISPGPIDGLMGPQTRAAMEQYQRSGMASPMSAPMQRPTAAAAPSPMASYAPMQRPVSGAVPLPTPNPERMPMGMPAMGGPEPQMDPALMAQGSQMATPPMQSQMAPPSNQAIMNWRVPSPVQMGPQQAPGLQQAAMMGSPQFPPPVPPTPPMAQTVMGPNGPVTQPLIPPGAGQRQNRNIETMTMNELQDLIFNGDPNAEELRRATIRIEQLRVEALMMGQGVAPGAPMGAPMGPGM